MSKYLQVNSIALECWAPDDIKGKKPPLLLPKGAVVEVHKEYKTNKTPTGEEGTLYWIKFYGNDNQLWLVAPNYWEVTELDQRPPARVQVPPAIAVANAMYRLVRVDDYGETEKRHK